MASKSQRVGRSARKHGKRLMRGVSNTRQGSISMGIQKLMNASRIDKISFDMDVMLAFGNELLKVADLPDPEEFKITKQEAERAARSLVEGDPRKKALSHAATFAVITPAIRTVAKGLATGLTGPKGKRIRTGTKAFKDAIKDHRTMAENTIGGAGTGAALSTLSESRDRRSAREKVRKYIEESQAAAPTKEKLKAVL